MGAKIDLSGRVFGRLTVLAEHAVRSRRGSAWECRCQCGNAKVVPGVQLRNGSTKSCGCLIAETLRKRNTTHGLYRTPEHHSWRGMNERCFNPNHKNYNIYGGRGITVCDRWRVFENFLADMGTRPSPKCSIDRIDTNGNYEPPNCRWATTGEQSNNRSNNRIVVVCGESMTIKQACDKYNLPYRTIEVRLLRGWTDSDAIFTPIVTPKMRTVEIDGKSLAFADACRMFGISTAAAFARIKAGASEYDAVTKPLTKRRKLNS